MALATTALVIAVGDRFFARVKNRRVQTAWSLAGAKLFLSLPNDERIVRAKNALTRKGYRFSVVAVQLDPNRPGPS